MDFSPLRLAANILNVTGLFPDARSHYELILHKRHWIVGHNARKVGAKMDS